jgi:hypothetical protein
MILSDPLFVALAALAHVLVLVYWLGGDLGAFYASTILTRASETPVARVTAARILNAVDMAPRTALLLAFPTGASLAAAKGWIALLLWAEAALWLVAALWVALIWRLHNPAPARALKALDLVLRLAALGGLFAAAALLTDWPLFIRLKAALLALAISLGLAVRGVLGPFGPAFAAIAQGHATPEAEAALSGALGRARLFVAGIWITLLSAAALGLWTPL